MVAALTIAGSLAGWVVLFAASLAGPRLGRSRAGPGPGIPAPGAEPPAVVSLLGGRPDRDGFAATLLDLAARGWFGLTPPAAGAPVICGLPAEAPVEELTSYERQAVSHLAQRTGAQQEIPADALLDGFAGGEEQFLKEFRHEVIADARARGLSRPTLTTSRKTQLCLLALIPAGAALLLTRHAASQIVFYAFYYLVLCGIAARVDSERLTPAGQVALGSWELAAPAAAGPGTREGAYAAALGQAQAAVFAPRAENVVWSGYGDSWRSLTVGDPGERMWPGLPTGAFVAVCLLAVPGIPLLAAFGYLSGQGHGAELGILTGVLADAAIAARAIGRWSHLPWFAEFDGLVLRQWQTGGESSDDGIEYYVAVDDGAAATAWAFGVTGGVFGQLVPGTIVHVRMNPRLNKLLEIQPLRQLPVAPLLNGAVDPRAPS